MARLFAAFNYRSAALLVYYAYLFRSCFQYSDTGVYYLSELNLIYCL